MFDWLTDAFSFDLDVAPDVEVNADYAESLRDAEMTRLANIPEGISSSGAVQSDYSEYIGKNNGISGGITGVESEAGAAAESPQPYVDSDPEGDLRDARMAQLFDIDIGTSSSGTQQQASAPKEEPNTFDKVMATLQKNPRMAAALIQGASGLIAGAGAGYAAKNKQEWEDKKIQEAWERRRLEAKPGTVRKENWGGLIQTAKG